MAGFVAASARASSRILIGGDAGNFLRPLRRVFEHLGLEFIESRAAPLHVIPVIEVLGDENVHESV